MYVILLLPEKGDFLLVEGKYFSHPLHSTPSWTLLTLALHPPHTKQQVICVFFMIVNSSRELFFFSSFSVHSDEQLKVVKDTKERIRKAHSLEEVLPDLIPVMKTKGIVWSLWALFLFYGGYQTDADGVETSSEQRRASSGRKRSRTSGSVSSFRSDQQHSSGNIPMPVDPLFSDQREIRLTFSKVLSKY